MKALRFYKNQIIIDRAAETNPKQIVHCASCNVKLLLATTKTIVICPSCNRLGKVGDPNGNFERALFDARTALRT